MKWRIFHANTVDGLNSPFKRGMKGVYQHCGKQHLQRYAEIDFRYDHREAICAEDAERGVMTLQNATGKRLKNQRPSAQNV